jgi:hypothetical protein
MNHKERMSASLQRQPVGRVPVFMWFHPATAQHLAGVLEIPESFAARHSSAKAWLVATCQHIITIILIV